jgi:adenylylsulfate kinase
MSADSVSENIIPHKHSITHVDRVERNGYRPVLVWLTGLSGSGKSTLASEVEKALFTQGLNTYILDGDNIRSGLNKDLDFGDEARKENIRRIGEVSKLFIDSGTIVLTAFISPFIDDRKQAKDLAGADNFIEVFVDCPLEVCERRDVKGLYKKAREGKIKNFTGIDSPFEQPKNADVVVKTNEESLEVCTKKILEVVLKKIKN